MSHCTATSSDGFGRGPSIAGHRDTVRFDPHVDHAASGATRAAPLREFAARVSSVVLGSVSVLLCCIGFLSMYYAFAGDVSSGARGLLFALCGVLPLWLAAELWARGRPSLARLLAGGLVPVRLSGDLTWPLCYRYLDRKRSSGTGFYGGASDAGGGGDGGGGG